MSAPLDVSYDTKIPNNVGLSSDRKVLKALEKWHPGYIDWWNKLIPQNFQESMVYLRTAVSVDPKGWAKFDYVKMPDYRWGVLLAPQVEGSRDPYGRAQRRKSVAGSAGRIPQYAQATHRDPRRHRAGLG